MRREQKRVSGEQIAKAWRDGLSTSAIAERFGLTRKSVNEKLNAAGIEREAGKCRTRYDGCGGTVGKGGALQRMAARA